MSNWKIEFSVNGVRGEMIIGAYNIIDAQNLIRWQFYGQSVNFYRYSKF